MNRPARTPAPSPAARRPRWARSLALAAATGLLTAGVLSGCATLDEKQRAWIFQPSDRTWSGGLAAAEGMDEVWIPFRSRQTGQDVRLHGLWLPQARTDAPVLLYLHGARWDVRGSAHRMRRMQELGFAVLGVDYRGFGQSSPALPSEDLAHEDALAAWQWLAERQPQAPRYLFGHSLGGAIAVRLAAELSSHATTSPIATVPTPAAARTPAPGLAGLIVEGSFTSIPDVVKQFKYGWLPVGPLITQRFEAAERIGQVKAPVLVVHGSADRLIPPALGQALYAQAPQPKQFVLVEGGSHHNTNAVGQGQYRAALASLFGLGEAGGR